MKGIYRKLMEVQRCLKAPKGQYNAFGKYSYRSCEDILDAVKPLLSEQGAALILSDKIECISGRYYVQALARFIDIESGEEIASAAYAREEEQKKGMDGSQITGASSSYARKYALNGLFCIDDNKDSDSTNAGQETPGQSPNKGNAETPEQSPNKGNTETPQKPPNKGNAETPGQSPEGQGQPEYKGCMTKERVAALHKAGEALGCSPAAVNKAVRKRLKKEINELNQTEFAQAQGWFKNPKNNKKEDTHE